MLRFACYVILLSHLSWSLEHMSTQGLFPLSLSFPIKTGNGNVNSQKNPQMLQNIVTAFTRCLFYTCRDKSYLANVMETLFYALYVSKHNEGRSHDQFAPHRMAPCVGQTDLNLIILHLKICNKIWISIFLKLEYCWTRFYKYDAMSLQWRNFKNKNSG